MKESEQYPLVFSELCDLGPKLNDPNYMISFRTKRTSIQQKDQKKKKNTFIGHVGTMSCMVLSFCTAWVDKQKQFIIFPLEIPTQSTAPLIDQVIGLQTTKI